MGFIFNQIDLITDIILTWHIPQYWGTFEIAGPFKEYQDVEAAPALAPISMSVASLQNHFRKPTLIAVLSCRYPECPFCTPLSPFRDDVRGTKERLNIERSQLALAMPLASLYTKIILSSCQCLM